MKTSLKGLALALSTSVLVSLGGSALVAQDKTGSNVAMGADSTPGAVAQLAMAQELYAFGVSNNNVLAVITAADMAGTADTTDVDRTPETSETEGGDTASNGDGVDAPTDAAAMLATATEMAGGDELLDDLIADVAAGGSRGRVGGASKTLSRLRAGHTDVFTVPFYGNSFAEIAIVGDGDADLDVLVTDENGNVICKDTSYSDQVYCSFTPRWDGYFVIGVVNQGRMRNSYYILTN